MNQYCQPVARVPPRLCSFCYKSGNSLDYAMSHNLYNFETGNIECQHYFAANCCNYCKELGHPIKFCEKLRLKNERKKYKKNKYYSKEKKYTPQTLSVSPPRTPPDSPPRTPPGSPPRTPPRISPSKRKQEPEYNVINGIEQWEKPKQTEKMKDIKRRMKKNKMKKVHFESTLEESKGPMTLEELQ